MSQNDTEILKAACDVLITEASALEKLAKNMPMDFVHLCEAILACKGRVIVGGVGKSGHIARKISATLASTGTPSYYIHPTEASHGDMGIIVEGDICILISNSGETAELQDLITYTKRFAIPIAAISSRSDSTLMKAAKFQLLLPEAAEACAIGMAPTTSTTMTLALGDALAVALMHQKAFKAESFRVFHPGGKLGAKMAQVKDIMYTMDKFPAVAPDTPMQDALLEMTSKGFGLAVVLEHGKVVGAITDGDLRRHMDNLLKKSAGDIASIDPITVEKDTLAAEALHIMNTHKIGVLIVADSEGKAEGIFHIHDLLRSGTA